MEPKDFQPEIKPPKPFCIEQFVGCSKEFKEKTLRLITLYHECLINARGGDDFMRYMYDVCLSLEQEMRQYNALAGFLLECNLFNLWNLFRNYKNKQSAESANTNPCALMAQQFLKFHTERLLVCTDRFFSTGCCSQINMPYDLCQHVFKFQQDLRKRCIASWKTLSGGRRAFMTVVQDIFTCFTTLRANELITPRQQAFFKLSYPPCRVQNVINILNVVHTQGIKDLKSLNMQKIKKRTPHAGIFSASGQPLFPIPEALLVDFNGEGIIRSDIADVSPFLQNPEEFLATDFFTYIKRFQGVGVQIRDPEPRYQPASQQPQQALRPQQQVLQQATAYPASVQAGGFAIQTESPMEGTSAQYFLAAQQHGVVGFFPSTATLVPIAGGTGGTEVVSYGHASASSAATFSAPSTAAAEAGTSGYSAGPPEASSADHQTPPRRSRKATAKRKHQQVQDGNEDEGPQRHPQAHSRQFFQGAASHQTAQPAQVLQQSVIHGTQGALYFMGPAQQIPGDHSQIPVISNAMLQSVLQQQGGSGAAIYDLSQLQPCVVPVQQQAAQEVAVPTAVIHYQPATQPQPQPYQQQQFLQPQQQAQTPSPQMQQRQLTPQSSPEPADEEEEGPLNLTTRTEDHEILEEILSNLYPEERRQQEQQHQQGEEAAPASPSQHEEQAGPSNQSGETSQELDIFSLHNLHLRKSLFE
ncbi:protein Rta [Equid gammaherpesvirus 2]|nr:protein Rta [Equid gammaherpesvirus 2]UTM04591.1 protein Rta [Equid gammaherpesvirus 2]